MRVSTDSQDELLQRQAREKAAVDALYMDHAVSGTTTSRPKLDKMFGRHAERRYRGLLFTVATESRN
ncbi:recombinase family protein [Mycobacteroides abscessus]|nr:recombinase family protein [Mycobacteroides abscessus]